MQLQELVHREEVLAGHLAVHVVRAGAGALAWIDAVHLPLWAGHQPRTVPQAAETVRGQDVEDAVAEGDASMVHVLTSSTSSSMNSSS